ncbi:MAG: hypothetical protein M3209_07475 [Acidobacteriota bacterium]|nr:hypothetical protein [Acidobacteriota bacterium]
MAYSPKENEEKMMKVLNAWKTLAPAKTFAGVTLAEFETQVNTSLTPRQRLVALEDEKLQQMTTRDAADQITMNKILSIVAGVVADPTEGANSALYEAMGYIRKDARKSGLTRKKVHPAPTV